MAEPTIHERCVDTWLERTAAKGLPRDALLDLFEAALGAVWAQTSTTLGVVTLGAIADRVMHNAAEHVPAFASLAVEPNGRIHARALRHSIEDIGHMKLLEGMRSVLVEFLTVIGNLTAEILTPELHAELSAVTSTRAYAKAPRRQTIAPSRSRASQKDSP